MAIHFYIVDTETTGLKAGYHEVIEISIIRCSDQEQKNVVIKAEYPERANKQALDIQNKTLNDLFEGIEKSEGVDIIHNFLLEDEKTPAHRCIVGHSVPFDRRHLFATWESVNKTFPADLWLCTKQFTRKLAKKQGIIKPKLNLKNSLKIAGLEEIPGAHTASVDALNAYELFQQLMAEKLNHVSLIKTEPHKK